MTSNTSDASLTRRTVRTVGLLVAACVLFVGVLSISAVLITTRALTPPSAAQATDSTDVAKKPLSI